MQFGKGHAIGVALAIAAITLAPVLVTFRLNVVVLMVFGSIGSLKVTVAVAPGETPLKFAGG